MTRTVLAVLTYRRPAELNGLLPLLLQQGEQAATARVRVLVVDNDPEGTGRPIAAASGADYAQEVRPGIAAARNRALDEARDDDLLVFIDDDERPEPGWLDALLSTHRRLQGAGVVGPVVSSFEGELPGWVAAGDFFHRRRLPTGTPVTVAATNNILLDLDVLRHLGLRFDERFGLSGGSDTLFSRSLVAGGGKLYWCDEALVVDRVPCERMTRRWVLTRAVRSGNSWGRTSLFLAPRHRREWVRLRLVGMGLARLLAGGLRWLGGSLASHVDQQAKGLRTAARGLGMVSACLGHVQVEYARPVPP